MDDYAIKGQLAFQEPAKGSPTGLDVGRVVRFWLDQGDIVTPGCDG